MFRIDHFLIVVFALVFAVTIPTVAASSSNRPNIIFILADDLGYTDIANYGSKYYETPNIDKLAGEGLKFTSGYTCGPNCQPTRAAIMSGQYGPRTGVYTVGNINRFNWQSRPLRPVDNMTELPLDKVTLAQSLKQAGYVTGLFGKWHLGNQGPHHPSQRGFDEAIVTSGKHFNFTTNPPVEYPEGTYLADFLAAKATDFMHRHKDKPFFLYLPHYGVHSPHEAKAEIIKRFAGKSPDGGHHDPAYAAMIASVDDSVGTILATLDELNLAENTLVIFSSDNGGVGGYQREGIGRNNSITDNAPLRGGKGMLYEGGIRVPYVFRWKNVISPGQVTDIPINSVDLYPTLLEIAQASSLPDQPLDGESYLSVLKSPQNARLKRGAIFWHFPGYLGQGENSWRTTPVSVIRSGDWKLLEFLEDGKLELYHLKDDVGERHNLADQMPDITADLHAKLVAWRDGIGAPLPTKNDAISASVSSTKGKGKGKGKGDSIGKGNGKKRRKLQEGAREAE